MTKKPNVLGTVYDFTEKYGYKSTVVGYNHSPGYQILKTEKNDGSVHYECLAKFKGTNSCMMTGRKTLDEAVSVAKGYLKRVSNKNPDNTLWIEDAR